MKLSNITIVKYKNRLGTGSVRTAEEAAFFLDILRKLRYNNTNMYIQVHSDHSIDLNETVR